MELQTVSRVIFAGIFILAGVMHFFTPKFFLYIMPLWVPQPKSVNLIVGAIECVLGIALLIEPIKSIAAWGLIALLVAVFPANVRHHQLARQRGKQVWITLLRLPLQALLIYWAYSFV